MLYFFVNGKEYNLAENEFQPEQTLLTWLRDQGLTGTKLGCGEGGCGACTVSASSFDAVAGKVEYRSVNACITPVCAMDGCHVLTAEGIGSTRDTLHPTQQKLADFHGSQCGFCTPGFVMSMYSLLRKDAEPSKSDIEHSLDGNLCRCTGYRPILDAFKDLGSDKPHGSGCCKEVKDGDIPPYWDRPEIPFPTQLLPAALPARPLKFVGSRATWHRPSTLTGLLELKRSLPSMKIVVGNSELEIERKFRNSNWEHLVCTSHVPEMVAISCTADGVHVGASTTLTHMKELLEAQQAASPAYAGRNYQAVLDQLRWFAGTQIRNVGAMGSNVANASPISDLNPVLMSSGSSITLVNTDNVTRSMKVRDFFKERLYRQTQLAQDEVVLSFFIPATKETEFSEGFKVSRRREDDIAIVTAGIRVLLTADNQVVEFGASYGGMAASTVMARKVEEFLIGKKWTRENMDQALSILPEDLPLAPGAPGGMIEYRRTMAASFLFKFFFRVLKAVDPAAMDPRDASAAVPYSRPMSSGIQHFKATGEKISVDKVQGPFNVEDGVGKPVKHAAADLHVTGEAIYVDDMSNPQYGLYAGLVLTEIPKGRVVSVDTAAALALKGVHAYIDHTDITGNNKFGAVIWDEEIFCSGEFQYVGQIIGVVVAETQALARRAAGLVKVVTEASPHILTIEEAIAANSFIGDEARLTDGDVEGAMASAEHTVEGEVRIGGQEHFYLETNTSMIVPGEKDEFTVFTSSQNPTKTANYVAHILGVDKNRVVCKMKRMGGGFGGKETRSVFLAMACAVAARKLNKPVRISLDRDQDMCITGQRHPFLAKYKVGFTAEGKITAADVRLYSNGGFSLDLSRPVLERALFHTENSYAIPNFRVRGLVCRTNLPTNTAFRGFGGPQGMMASEAFMDDVARKLGKHGDDIRKLNLYATRGAVTPYGQPLVDCFTREMWSELEVSADYHARRAAVDAFNAANKWIKRGIAFMPVKFGMSFTAKFMNQASALVHLLTDGSVLVSHGGTEMGQGLHTKMSQIAAAELGVPLSKVHISETATDKCANTHPTAASVGADLNGFAVQDACRQINARLEILRATMPGASTHDLAMQAWLTRVDMSAHGFYITPDVGFDWVKQEGKPFHYFSYGVSVAEVEVDVLSGDFTLLRADIIHDVGDSLNPSIDIGQVEGGFVQGVGLFMTEEMQWMKNGQLFTRGPSTYKIPSVNDIPIDFRVKLFADAPNRKTVYSSKGVGEPPLNHAISCFLAVKNAVGCARADNGLHGAFTLDTPASCERIRLACGDPILKTYAPTEVRPVGSW